MEQPSESETLIRDNKSPRSSGVLEPVATTTAEEEITTDGQSRQATTPIKCVDEDAPPSGTFSPPYWKGHERTSSISSDVSCSDLRPPPIILEDHSDEDHEVGRACWAKQVRVDDYVVVGGGSIAGAYVVWNCTVETLKGAPMTIRKRYSEFDSLRANLVRAFPHSAASIPELPRKSVISRFRPKFLEQRRAGLSHFLNCVLLNPEFSGSPLVKDFIFL